MIKRVLTSIIGIPLLIIILSLGGTPLLISLIIVASLGLYELYKTYQFVDNGYIIIEIIIGIGLLIIMAKYQDWILPYLIIIFIFHFIYQILSKNSTFEKALLGYNGIIYIVLLLGHILLFNNIKNGSYLVWLVFIIAWSTDTFAYFIGIKFGKHKLIPAISPKKSIEGSIGGVIGSLLSCTLYGAYLYKFHNIYIPLYNYIILGIVSSILAQFGDLTASFIKRNYNVKDFGNIFPGHGGILDRFDSILFTAPIVYYYIVIFT
ncbi:MAG TPA: phosphatidate cytidylyltransferase [Eubacteriaceae bacterium]|nr:phosphatidate cytidylyltransferase [Eubacteriaceae bacterium]